MAWGLDSSGCPCALRLRRCPPALRKAARPRSRGLRSAVVTSPRTFRLPPPAPAPLLGSLGGVSRPCGAAFWMCTGLPVKTRFLIVGHFYLSFKDNFWKVECCSREDSGHGEFWLVLVTERRSTGRGKGFPVSGHSRGWGPYRQREPLIPTRRCPTRRWRLPASPVLTLLFCLGLSRGASPLGGHVCLGQQGRAGVRL